MSEIEVVQTPPAIVEVTQTAPSQVDVQVVLGPPGQDGEDGQPGSPGLSAYQVAVGEGFVGTEAEWLASLEGQPGDDGEPGPPGEGATVYLTEAELDAAEGGHGIARVDGPDNWPTVWGTLTYSTGDYPVRTAITAEDYGEGVIEEGYTQEFWPYTEGVYVRGGASLVGDPRGWEDWRKVATLPSSGGVVGQSFFLNAATFGDGSQLLSWKPVASGRLFKPASATAAGTKGEIHADGDGYLYVCVATNTWRRVALSSW